MWSKFPSVPGEVSAEKEANVVSGEAALDTA